MIKTFSETKKKQVLIKNTPPSTRGPGKPRATTALVNQNIVRASREEFMRLSKNIVMVFFTLQMNPFFLHELHVVVSKLLVRMDDDP